MSRKNGIKAIAAIVITLFLGACNNYFHELIPPNDNLILSFEVTGQIGDAEISEDAVLVVVGKDSDVSALVPVVSISKKASLLPVTFEYISAAFPGVDLIEAAMNIYTSEDITSHVTELIKANPDFNVPALDIPIDFTGPVIFLVVSGQGNIRQYTVNVVEDSGEPRLLNIRFSKYENAELISDALCLIDEGHAAIYANAVYPTEMDYLSYALIPSFNILGDSFNVDGIPLVSSVNAIQFSQHMGIQTKIITIFREGKSKDYTLTVLFNEDPDTIRSITDFRFHVAENPGIAVNAVASIINTDNTGMITVQVFYWGAKPSLLIPRFISPGNVSVGGVKQYSGSGGYDYASPMEYRVVSKNGMYSRIYTVKVEYVSLTESMPKITAFKFSAIINEELVQDAEAKISDGLIMIEARYGGSSAPVNIKPEFSATGLVTVYGSVQVSGASPQDFSRQIKYTVSNPLNPLLTCDYWVQCKMVRDTSSDASITAFSFHPDENSNLADEVVGKIDQINGKITLYAPVGSGAITKTMIPRFTAAGQVSVDGTPQVSGVSGMIFNAPVTYTVVSANGKNTRSYTVNVRELQSTIYVKHNASGLNDGANWHDAFVSLKAACEAAAQFPEDVPKEIWIAAGTYTPGNKSSDYFALVSNTSFIGGFAGTETAKSQRDPAVNTVTITADLGGGIKASRLFYAAESAKGDFSFEHLQFKNTASAGINISSSNGDVEINNCVFSAIASGHAVTVSAKNISINGVNIDGVSNGRGLSLIESGNAVITNTIIKNCVYTERGGGILINGTGSANISYVTITGCIAAFTGVGMSIECRGNVTVSNATIDNVTLTSGTYCGAIYRSLGSLSVVNSSIRNITGSSNCAGIFFNPIINANLAVSNLELQNIPGNGIYCFRSDGTKDFSGITAVTGIGGAWGIFSPSSSDRFTLTNSRFASCGVYFGGTQTEASPIQITDTEIINTKNNNNGIYADSGTGTINIERVTVDGAGGVGIVAHSENSTILINNSTVKNGLSDGFSLYDGQGYMEINGTTVINNAGDGVGLSSGNLTMNNCTISGNSQHGVFVYNGNLTMNSGTISNNAISNNGSVYNGGGMCITKGVFTMNGGTISGNKASSSGGGVYVVGSEATFIMTDGTISGNSAGFFGGGVMVDSASNVTKTGGTIYGADGTSNANTAGSRGAAFYRDSVFYSNNTIGPGDNLSW